MPIVSRLDRFANEFEWLCQIKQTSMQNLADEIVFKAVKNAKSEGKLSGQTNTTKAFEQLCQLKKMPVSEMLTMLICDAIASAKLTYLKGATK